MRPSLSFALKILALVSWWYIPAFGLTLLSIHFPKNSVLRGIAPEVRGDIYAWDYELFFVLIFAVWGWYLWRASQAPKKYFFFVRFTIWATIAHIAGMLLVGVFRPDELTHLLLDASVFVIPLTLLLFAMKHETGPVLYDDP